MESGATTPEARGDLTARFTRKSRRSSFSLLDREALDTFCERGVLGTVLAILVWGPIAKGSALDPDHFLISAPLLVLLGLGVLMSAFWLVRIWVRKQYRILLPPVTWGVIAFAGYAVWRYTWVDYAYAARLELLQVLLYALLFFAILDNLTSQENVQILLFALVGLAMLNSFYAVFQYFTDSQHVLWFPKPAAYRGRGSGTYVCPNHLAGFLEMLLPVALAYTVLGRSKALTKVFLGYSALALVAGIGVTLSRGGYLATAAALLVFFIILLWNRDHRLPAIGLIVLLITTSTFFGVRSWQAEKRFAQAQHYNMRLLYWKPAYAMWKENFWWGVGPQHYDWRLRKWRYWQLQGRPIYVHNDYLNTLAEYGTAGGLIVLLTLGGLGWGVARSWKYVRKSNEIASKPSNRAAVVLGCTIGLLALVFHSATDFNMHIPGNAVVAVTLMAVLASHIRFATERFWVNPAIFGRIMATLLILGGAGYISLQMTRLVPQTYWLGRSEAPLPDQKRLEFLQKAYAAEPGSDEVVMNIGLILRRKAFNGDDGWQEVTREAMRWFEKASILNPWNPFSYTNLGACYDWLKEHGKAAEYFDKALALDPKGHFVLFWAGWHKLQIGELAEARKYFVDSWNYYWQDNELAKKYIEIIDSRLAEQPQNR